MSDWELDLPKDDSEWSLDQPMQEKDSSYFQSLSRAPGRIGEDIKETAANALRAIPDYLSKARTEVPGVYNLLTEHPGRALASAGAGITEMGHNLLNFPKGIAEYASNRLHLLPESIAKHIPYQKDISQDISNVFGDPRYAGEALVRGGFRNLPTLLPAGAAALKFNPLRMTSKNIAKDVMRQRELMKEKYTGEKGLYNKLFEKAEKKGAHEIAMDPNKIDINAILSHADPKYIESLNELILNPNARNAHGAKSDLGKFINKMERQDERMNLTKSERNSLNAAKNAKQHIEEEMFKGHPELTKEYKDITTGYANEVIPYTKNKAINEFKRGELSEDELVRRISRGKFAAKRGKSHGGMQGRKVLKKTHNILSSGPAKLAGGLAILDYLTKH